MAWIESHQALGQHPKTRKLARKLGCSVPAAVGHLQFLWWWALDYAPDGDVTRFEEDDIADAVLWEGAGSQLMAALIDAGFIDLEEDVKRIHDWGEYAGRLLDKRAANTRRKQESRARHAPVTRDTPETPAPVTGLPTQPTNPTNRTEPTEQNQPTERRVPARAARGVVSLTSEEKRELIDKWVDRLPDVKEQIDLAVSHENSKKYPTNQRGYVDNWLRREHGWRGGTANGSKPEPRYVDEGIFSEASLRKYREEHPEEYEVEA